GFFKAALFLCAGNVLHALGKSSAPVDEAGGMALELPLTAKSFALAGAALAGIPGTAGFFSKDLVLEAAVHRHWLLGAAAGLVAVGSGLYIGRLYWLTFHGQRPEQQRHGHAGHPRDPWTDWPVAILAGLSVLGGLAVIPTGVLWRLITAAPLWAGEPFPHPHFDWGLAAAGIAAAAVGLGVSWTLSMGRPSWDWDWRRSSPALERWLDADLGWQPLVTNGVAAAGGGLARFIGLTFDLRTWDRLVEATADSFVGLAEGLSGLSRGLLNEYLWWMAVGTSLFMLGLAWAR
ncbi:MAG: hypothetical protein HY553_07055, partial [Elusimicrobia bacterium]|nr:hypothetical protein [Elusimicrobiota bacterium]